jgi:hypothetical protein
MRNAMISSEKPTMYERQAHIKTNKALRERHMFIDE